MATTSTLVFFCTNLFFFVRQVSAYYCDSDECKETDYCCGDNICCASYTVWELWYFWFGIVLFLVLLFMCICLWKSKYRDRRLLMSYALVNNKQHANNPVESPTDVFPGPPGKSQGKYHPLQNAPATYKEALEYQSYTSKSLHSK